MGTQRPLWFYCGRGRCRLVDPVTAGLAGRAFLELAGNTVIQLVPVALLLHEDPAILRSSLADQFAGWRAGRPAGRFRQLPSGGAQILPAQP